MHPDERAELDKREEQKINRSFTYHAPKETQPERYESLRGTARDLALRIVAHVPPSRERSLALTKLEESIMWANKGIACNE